MYKLITSYRLYIHNTWKFHSIAGFVSKCAWAYCLFSLSSVSLCRLRLIDAFNCRYNISFIDPPLGGFGEILPYK